MQLPASLSLAESGTHSIPGKSDWLNRGLIIESSGFSIIYLQDHEFVNGNDNNDAGFSSRAVHRAAGRISGIYPQAVAA